MQFYKTRQLLLPIIIVLTTFTGCLSNSKQESKVSENQIKLSYVSFSNKADINPLKTREIQLKPYNGSVTDFEIFTSKIINANLSGLGGAFNEQGGEAFMSLPETLKLQLAEALFNTEKGAGLTFCRTAVGSSDFGLGAYSYSETPEDYNMERFSVARDMKSVIPFIQAAKSQNSSFKLFASPWSPPGWMKKSGRMDGGDISPEKNILKADTQIYKAYALYFVKYIKAYAEHGINIDRLVVQNEADMNPTYPGCDMLPLQMYELIFDYIKPLTESCNLNTEIWAGSFRSMRNDAENFMRIEGSDKISGLGLQYCSVQTLINLQSTNPNLNLMHTEGVCHNGSNSIIQAKSRFSEVAMWLNNGCENYCYWNIALNENSESAWGWKQNSLVKINRENGTITYNADFIPMYILSRFIKPGDSTIKAESKNNETIIAVKKNNTIKIFLQNKLLIPVVKVLSIDGTKYKVNIPANSLSVMEINN